MVRIVPRIDVRCNGERKRSTRDGDRSAYFESKKGEKRVSLPPFWSGRAMMTAFEIIFELEV
jgi:hypothetical protein|tara:strand:+ start:888 stop:1073 length:186 start_codon:yes stop_codon:yes gene_type:complete